jgi:hypothetical protein
MHPHPVRMMTVKIAIAGVDRPQWHAPGNESVNFFGHLTQKSFWCQKTVQTIRKVC